MHYPSSMWLYSPTQELSEPHSLGIFIAASVYRHDPSLIQSPAPLSSLENGGGAESSKLLFMAWSFW